MSNIKKLFAVFLISAAAVPLFATTVERIELPQLVSRADNIVQGRVESVEARYEDRMIYTYVSLVIDDAIKGDRRRTIQLRQMGGTIGAKTMWIAGMPQFKNGDQVILFLKDRQDGAFDVIGLNQGKYDIVENYAVSHVSGVSVLDPRTGRMSEAGFVDKAPVDQFKAKIRELMR